MLGNEVEAQNFTLIQKQIEREKEIKRKKRNDSSQKTMDRWKKKVKRRQRIFP